MKIYYAHPITIYGTQQEADDLRLLRTTLGFEVVNPNSPETVKAYRAARNRQEKNPDFDAFEYVFKPLVMSCEGVAFRAFRDGRIGAGVLTECNWAVEDSRPVIELPTWLPTRFMTVSQTRERIQDFHEGR